MLALKTMKNELLRVNKEMADITTDLGYIKKGCSFKYEKLLRESMLLSESIKQWEQWISEGWFENERINKS